MSLWPIFDRVGLVRNKCLVSDMTHNSFQDCDEMFIPEFKALLDYCVDKFNAMYPSSEDNSNTELASLPMGTDHDEPEEDIYESFGGEYYQ